RPFLSTLRKVGQTDPSMTRHSLSRRRRREEKTCRRKISGLTLSWNFFLPGDSPGSATVRGKKVHSDISGLTPGGLRKELAAIRIYRVWFSSLPQR
ncbi:hypothetical protein AVEN_93107-1, partial [Araneus ventricosus]